MPSVEIPSTWKEIEDYAKRYSTSEPFIDYIGTFKTTNAETVRRVCMADRPAFLPGAFQPLEYTRAIFSENSRGEEIDEGQAALRYGLWSTYFAKGGRLENQHTSRCTDPQTRQSWRCGNARYVVLRLWCGDGQ